jgi:hypothetical protein
MTHLGSQALANGIRHSQLTIINLCWAWRELQQVLFDAIHKSTSIECLSLAQSTVDFDTLSTLLAPTSQTQPSCHIVNLVFRRAGFDMRRMSLILHNNESVKRLSFSGIPMSDDAIKHFVKLWKQESPLQELEFQGNGISSKGARVLIQAVSRHPLLQVLQLSGNNSIGCDGLTIIGKALRNVQLRKLAIYSRFPCYGNDGTAKKKIYRTCRALADGLNANNTIQMLELNDATLFGVEGLQMLMKATANRRILLNLTIGVRLGSEVAVIGDELRDAQLGELVLTVPFDYLDDTLYGAFESLSRGLSRSRTLCSFTFSKHYVLSSNEAELLMLAVGSHPTIRRLHLLTKGKMSWGGLQTIGEHLANATSLSALSLNGFRYNPSDFNHAYDDTAAAIVINSACQALANGLRTNGCIQELNLFHRGMQFPNALELVRAATNHPSLQKLSLDLNLSISLVEVGQLADVLGTLHLKEFVTNFRCSWSGSEEQSTNFRCWWSEVQSERSTQARGALLEGVRNNFCLHELKIPTLGLMDEIEFYLKLNRLGRRGLIQEQGISPAHWCDVLTKLDVAEIFYFFSEQPSLMSWLLSSSKNDE